MTEVKSPQLENGHLRIANELNDVIWGLPFSHRQHKVIFAIIRKTYGYGKKEDDMSASQIGEFCRMSRTHVTSTLNQLAEMNVIHKKPGVYGSVLSINKDYSKWVFPSTESVQVSQNGTSTETVQGVPIRSSASTESVQVDSTESVHTKDNLPKDNLQKNPPAPQGGRTDSKTKNQESELPEGFMRAWQVYPKRDGANPRRDAASAWRARLREGETPQRMMLATLGYAKAMENKGKVGSEFVMQAVRFFGKSRPYEDYLGATQSPDGQWWQEAGFSSLYEAENAGCNQFIYEQFQNGKRMESHA